MAHVLSAVALLLSSFLLSSVAIGQGVPTVPTEAALAADVEGTIMSVDASNQMLKIHHDRIESIGWPAMVMDFYVENRAMLSEVYPGERVRFSFAKKNGRYVITDIGAVPPAA